MSGNLDKILSNIQKRTAKDIEALEEASEKKRGTWMNKRSHISG